MPMPITITGARSYIEIMKDGKELSINVCIATCTQTRKANQPFPKRNH